MKFIREDVTTLQFNSEGSVYTLVAKRSGRDRNGNPKYELSMVEVTESGIICLWGFPKDITSFNILDRLEGISAEIIRDGFEAIYY